jgi:hypothetical protein
MNTVTLRCPSIGCAQTLSVAAAARGKLVACRYCKRVVRVPAARAAAPAAAGGVGAAASAAIAPPAQ